LLDDDLSIAATDIAEDSVPHTESCAGIAGVDNTMLVWGAP
jgi:hypothetical protein